MLPSNLVSSFYFNNFAAAISAPFTSLNAYRAGVIDQDGNILKPESSIDPFEYLIIKLKKIFAELPAGLTKSKLNSYIPALQYFSEEAESFGIEKEQMDLLIEGFITVESNGNASYLELKEDMASGNLGGPASSPNQNTGSVTGFDLPMGGMLRRKPQQSVLGFEKQSCEMYDVCPEDFDLYSNPNLKSWDEVEDSPTKRLMQRSQRRNGGSTIVIRDLGTNRYHKLNLAPRNISKMFEDVDLSIFKDILNENRDNKPINENNGGEITTLDVIDSLNADLKDNGIQDLSNKKPKLHEGIMYDAMGDLLQQKGFKFNPTKNPKELKIGEYGRFKPGSGGEDIMIHHELGGIPHVTRIDTKHHSRISSVNIVLPIKTTIKGRTKQIPARRLARIFGTPNKSGTRIDVKGKNQAINQVIPEILTQKGGLTIIGNSDRVSIVHNNPTTHEHRKHDEALLTHLGLTPTHEPEEISRSSSPYIGNVNSPDRGENLILRITPSRIIERNGKKIDTLQQQQQNASILKIPKV